MEFYRKYNLFKVFVALLIVSFSVTSYAADINDIEHGELFEMSLTELMDIEVDVPATITEKDPLKSPASVTIITARDIALTPARNLLDLMEIYVPGALYMNHSVGPVPGIRGFLVDRPYKYLVNVNGVNVNIKAHYGARLELLNWDLNDIERIEVVRGPGSVTYGPGAIGGVINIYTKTASSAPGVEIGGHFWDKYDSIGNYIGYGRKKGELELYTYFSVVHTTGHEPDLFGVNSSGCGYLGSSGAPVYPAPPAEYLADYDNEPQIKAHLDVRFKKNWRFWARYVTSNHELMQGTAQQYEMPNTGGPYESFRQTRYRYYQFALENKRPLSENWSLKSTFGLSSIDVQNVEKYDDDIVNDRDNLLNVKWIWSENEYFSQFMFNYKPDEGRVKGAFGFEVSYDTIRPAWGKDKDDGLRLADGIMSGPTSEAYGTSTDGTKQYTEASNRYFAVGEGWETYSHAFIGELNIKWSPKSTILLSGRMDKHKFTHYMFSPRFAWIYEIKKDEYLKFIAQRSVRMNTQEELYMNEKTYQENIPEKLDTFELIYSSKPTKNLSFQTSAFYNKNQAIAWDWDLGRSGGVGTLKTVGLEVEAKYEKDHFNFGANHSFVKQLDFNRADEIMLSGISYSDYYRNAGGGVIINSKGNDLNNWANHATKFFTNIGLLDEKLTLHGDMQIFWGFEGMKDGLDALSIAGGNAANIQSLKDHDVYEMIVRGNLSLTYHINKSAAVTVFVHGIPIIGENKRYAYSSGYKNSYPDKTSWVEEPTVVGLRYHIRF